MYTDKHRKCNRNSRPNRPTLKSCRRQILVSQGIRLPKHNPVLIHRLDLLPITLPLGAARHLIPLFRARCILSGNGKNASLERATPSNSTPSFPRPSKLQRWHPRISASNKGSHRSFSPPSNTFPLPNRSMGLTFSVRSWAAGCAVVGLHPNYAHNHHLL